MDDAAASQAWNYPGHDIGQPVFADNPTHCSDVCSRVANAHHFSYRAHDKYCWCKEAGAGKHKVRDNYVQSGNVHMTSSDVKRSGMEWRRPCSASQASESLQRSIATFLPYAVQFQGWTRAIFVGDSLSGLVFMEFEDQMNKRFGEPVSRALFHRSTTFNKSPCSEWVVSPRNNTFAACYFSAGRHEGATRVILPVTDSSCGAIDSFDGVNIGDAIECMFQLNKLQVTDRIVLNTGVHHRPSRANVTIPPNVLAVPWWRRGNGQCLVWRETLPQHFPNTRTGAFEVFMGCDGPSSHQCAPIPLDALEFDQGYNEPAEAALRQVAQIDQGGRVQIARAYRPLLGLYDDHGSIKLGTQCAPSSEPGGTRLLDCTHFPLRSTALAVATCITLRELAACPQRPNVHVDQGI